MALKTQTMVTRNQHRQWMLKPQDLVVAFKLAVFKDKPLSYQELARQLHLSAFEAHAAVQRLLATRLVSEVVGIGPVRAAFADFVCFGALYAYPAVRTENTIGMPTAYGVEPMKSLVLYGGESAPVWPYEYGKARGMGVLPLYEKVPLAAMQDEALYELLALFDALRIGQARERELSGRLLRERLAK